MACRPCLLRPGFELLGCDVFEKHPEIWPERRACRFGRSSHEAPRRRRTGEARRFAPDVGSEATDAVLLTSLDEIAWLTNLRGRDVPCNPVFGAVMLVRSDRAELFSESVRFDETARSALTASGIELREPRLSGRRSKPWKVRPCFLTRVEPRTPTFDRPSMSACGTVLRPWLR